MKNPFVNAKTYIVHPYEQMVFISRSREEYNRWIEYVDGEKDAIGKESCGCFSMLSTPLTNGGVIFLLGWFNAEPPTLAHECFHCLMKIFDHCGVHFDASNNEHFAYSLSAMMKAIMEMKKK